MDTIQRSAAAKRRDEKRAREQHASSALAPRHPATPMGRAEAYDVLRKGPPVRLTEYHSSSHHRVSAPRQPTGMNERFVGFELELVPHVPWRLAKDAYSNLPGLNQFFGRMVHLASKAVAGYWSKVETDGTVPHGAEFISGYGPISVHHAAMMAVLTDPVIARLGSPVLHTSALSSASEAKGIVRCDSPNCHVCSSLPIPDGISEPAKLGLTSDKTGAGLHVHIHATDRLGRRLRTSDRQAVGHIMAEVLSDLRMARRSDTLSHREPAAKLWDFLVGREPTDFCKPGVGGHYESVNIDADRTPTIEVRSFRATVDARKFFARLEFALALYEYALDACITGDGDATMPEFISWLDEHAASQGLAALLPNLLAALAEWPLPPADITEGMRTPMTWLASDAQDRSADAVGESEPSADPDDEDEEWEDPDEDDRCEEPEEEEDEDEDEVAAPTMRASAADSAGGVTTVPVEGPPMVFVPWSPPLLDELSNT